MKKKPSNREALQLNLFDQVEEEPVVLPRSCDISTVDWNGNPTHIIDVHSTDKVVLLSTQKDNSSDVVTLVLNIEDMQTWVLNWGAQHGYPGFSFPFNLGPLEDRHNGLVWNGRKQWLENMGSQQRCEDYPGHWLQKCIEHIKRFDSGECEIPAWNFSRSQTGKEANGRKKGSTH